MIFGHQIACRDIKDLKNSNDIDRTSNHLEMTLTPYFHHN